MKRNLAALLSALLLFTGLHAQKTAPATLVESPPQSAGVSAERLARLDRFIQRYVDAGELNGATALIVRDGRIVYHKAFGYSDLERRRPMRRDDMFRIASMTKPIVSVAAMTLVEEGLMSLDDPLSKHIPAFKDAVVLDGFNPADTTYSVVKPRSEQPSDSS